MQRPQDRTTEDPSIVPGFEPELPLPRTEGGAYDPAFDPDRYDPDRYDPDRYDPDRYDPVAGSVPATVPGRLDPALDPDRYDPALDVASRRNPDGRTLPELLGSGAFEEPRDTWSWALGLVGVLVFLALASWVFGSVVKY